MNVGIKVFCRSILDVFGTPATMEPGTGFDENAGSILAIKRNTFVGYGLLFVVFCASPLLAQQTNPAQPITHELNVQLIQTTTTDGTEVAGIFGTPTQQADIEERLQTIWSQCGVRVNLLPTINTYANDFAFDGRPTDYSATSRPTSHLSSIISAGDSAGAGNSDPETIDAYFVDILPGFERLGANFVAGLANVDRNGLTMYVSDSLPTFSNGRSVVASVFAHEIGHNLGLNHETANSPNLMATSGGTGHLTTSQCSTIFVNNGGTDGFDLLQPAPDAACDFDGDGQCDLTDIDLLYDALSTNDATFDLDNSDGLSLVNDLDIGEWLVLASDPSNPYKADPAHTYVRGDINLNGAVDSQDLGLLLNSFTDSGAKWGMGNLNDDLVVNSGDLGLLLNNFGHGTVAATVAHVPEPQSYVLLALAAMSSMVLRRRR